MQPASRRAVLKQSLLLSAAAVALPAGRLAAAPVEATKPQPGSKQVILFQGDSITDAGRDRRSGAANDAGSLGRGYPLLAAGALLAEYPQADLRIYNRGISGNKVPDLDARWHPDCVALKPDVLSILIGINDLWHKLNGRYDGTVESFQSGYRALLERTQKALPETRIVICEPFVLRTGAVTDKWFPEFEQRRAVAEQLAGEFELDYVPFQSMFDKAVESAPPSYWAGDGVHPTLAGHALMAQTWRKVVGI